MSDLFDLIKDWWNGTSEEDERRELSKNAKDFVLSYYTSPGFNERLKKAPRYLQEYNSSPINPDKSEWGLLKLLKRGFKTYLNFDSHDSAFALGNNVTIGKIDFDLDSPLLDYGAVAAHEYGHVLDHNIIPMVVYQDGFKYPLVYNYSYIFPHFRNSKTYLQAAKKLGDTYEKSPNNPLFYSTYHDGAPEESYSDLIAFREALNRFNIYDSRKANNPFTKQHLLQWKKLNKHLRLFDNFTDDLIIQMMNDIAYNEPKFNEVSYAKYGTKLIRRKYKKY